MGITHTFVSTNADVRDSSYVGKDEWNAAHTITSMTSYLGYNTVGGSFETTPNTIKLYCKKLTAPSDGVLLSIGVHFKGDGTHAGSIGAYILSDSSGAPANLIAAVTGPFSTGTHQLNFFKNSTASWVEFPINKLLTNAQVVWAVISTYDGGASNGALQIAYDSDGASTDVTSTNGGYFRDVSPPSTTGGGRKYSIRGLFLGMS